jgi:hypothetical protein
VECMDATAAAQNEPTGWRWDRSTAPAFDRRKPVAPAAAVPQKPAATAAGRGFRDGPTRDISAQISRVLL